MDYKVTDDIHAGFVTGIDFRETQNSNYGNREAFTRTISSSITGKAGFQTEGLDRYFQATIRPNIGYHKLIQNDHDIDVNVFGEFVDEMGDDEEDVVVVAGVVVDESLLIVDFDSR